MIVKAIRLSGRFVALSQNISGCGACFSDEGDYVVVRDLATGRATFRQRRSTQGDIEDLVLKSNGSAAYLDRLRIEAPSDRRPVDVHVVTRGTDNIVDRGTDIDPTSTRHRWS